MTTKAVFDGYISGFKAALAGHDHITVDQLDAILDMIPDVIAAEVAAASSIEVTGSQTSPGIDGAFALKAGRDQVKRDKIDALIEELKVAGLGFPKTSGMLVPDDQLDSVIQQCEDMLAAQPMPSEQATVAGPEFPPPAAQVEDAAIVGPATAEAAADIGDAVLVPSQVPVAEATDATAI